MTTISFKVSNPNEATKLYSMLQAYGVEDLCVDNKIILPNYVVEAIEESISELDNGKGIPSDLVHKKAREL